MVSFTAVKMSRMFLVSVAWVKLCQIGISPWQDGVDNTRRTADTPLTEPGSPA